MIVLRLTIHHFFKGFSEDDKLKSGKNFFNSIPLKNSSIHHLQISEAIAALNYNNVNQLSLKGDINIDNIETSNPNTFFKNTIIVSCLLLGNRLSVIAVCSSNMFEREIYLQMQRWAELILLDALC